MTVWNDEPMSWWYSPVEKFANLIGPQSSRAILVTPGVNKKLTQLQTGVVVQTLIKDYWTLRLCNGLKPFEIHCPTYWNVYPCFWCHQKPLDWCVTREIDSCVLCRSRYAVIAVSRYTLYFISKYLQQDMFHLMPL